MSVFSAHTLAVLRQFIRFCQEHTISAWLVGGAVRDLVLGQVPADIDIAVDTNGLELAHMFATAVGGTCVTLKDARGTGRVVLPPDRTQPAPRLMMDVVQLQAPSLEADLRLRDFTINALALPLTTADVHEPFCTAQPGANLSPTMVIDPCGGWQDLMAGVLRLCHPAGLRLDPLRILRAVRLAAEHNLTIDPELDASLRHHAALIVQPAVERLRDELLKLLGQPYAAPWLRYLDDITVLTRIFPELEPARQCEQPIVHFLPVLAHSLEAVTCLEWLLAGLAGTATPDTTAHTAASPRLPYPTFPVAVQTYPDLPRTLAYAERLHMHFTAASGMTDERAALLKLATLLHDNAKPATKQNKPDGGVSFYGHPEIGAATASTIAQRLRLSRQATNYIALVVRNHMRPGQLRSTETLTMRAMARFLRDTIDAGPDVLLHALADHLATRGPLIDPLDWQHHLSWSGMFLDMHWGQPPERTRPLVNGNDLMQAFDLPPGKQIGILLREIQEAQAAGEISTMDEALVLARQILTLQNEERSYPAHTYRTGSMERVERKDANE